ncbi:hypothetical protein Pcinc_039628 [Petrolisthes cinctipes]|nr:hypothetical protein Pcinc_039628 [Petrolisthes cinctipes]
MAKAFGLPGFHRSDLESESDSDQESDFENDEATTSGFFALDSEDSEELFTYLPQHDGCFAHTLQLVVKDGMKEIGSLRPLVSKVSALVSHISKSTHATDLLQEYHRVQTANTTRWNSEVKMIRSVLKIPQDQLDQLDLDKVHKLTLYDRSCLQDLCDILVPFEEVIDITQGDKIETCSFVVPCIRGLRIQMAEMYSRFNSKLVSALRKSLEKRLSVYEDKLLYRLAATLDPRFKLAWCRESELKEQQAVLIKEVESIISSTTTCPVESSAISMTPPPPVKQSKLFSYMTAAAAAPITTRYTNSMEVSTYLADPCLPEDTDPLIYWKQNKVSMPTLTKLAMNYLVVPATSAPVERVFSVAGRILRPDRYQLSDKTFQRLVFIKYNKNLKL